MSGNPIQLARFFGRCFLLSVGFMVACSGHGPHAETIKETIASFEGEPAQLNTEPLAAGTDNTILVTTLDGHIQSFSTETRLDKLLHYPCSNCHTQASPRREKQAAHWERTQEHAPSQIMNCATCHDAETKMEKLRLLSGETISFDNVYNLCSQCHFEQSRDWLGGAHGKRLATWAGPRVIRNCTSCHDPHSPGFPKRWPSFSPTPPDSRLIDSE